MDAEDRPPQAEPPPVMGSWRALYGLLLGSLAGLIALLAFLTSVYQ